MRQEQQEHSSRCSACAEPARGALTGAMTGACRAATAGAGPADRGAGAIRGAARDPPTRGPAARDDRGDPTGGIWGAGAGNREGAAAWWGASRGASCEGARPRGGSTAPPPGPCACTGGCGSGAGAGWGKGTPGASADRGRGAGTGAGRAAGALRGVWAGAGAGAGVGRLVGTGAGAGAGEGAWREAAGGPKAASAEGEKGCAGLSGSGKEMSWQSPPAHACEGQVLCKGWVLVADQATGGG